MKEEALMLEGKRAPAQRAIIETKTGARTKKNNTRRELQWKLGGWGGSVDNDDVNSDASRGECLVRSSSHCRAAIRARTKHRNPRGWKNEYLRNICA